MRIKSELEFFRQEYELFKMKAIVLCPSAFKNLQQHLVQKTETEKNGKVVIKLSHKFTLEGKDYQYEGEFVREAKHSIPKMFKITQSLIQ